ncbi:hypothetical protein E8E13_008282 [Curvularia kusanoi]|uniref:Metallo-beta-lactamase domain-containing protein n=1 Tax=Curvularia kusanoi TaxID=90978 RepID=A0A9P4W6S5_CURKU|nr:hypothetical protein E8E13_008282 [Curvularia kusanoi]
MISKMDIKIPKGPVVVDVHLINPVNFGPAQIHRFMAPAVPALETFKTSPSHSFYIEHPSGRRLIFDLGIRKDYQNYSKSIADYLPTTKYDIEVSNNVSDILEANGVEPGSIEAVIWSHWHWDHIGDPSSFPHNVDLIVGQGFKDAMLPGYPANPNSPIRESDYANRELREISFDTELKIGQFPAFDYFGDGSFYLLDSPGHAIGHLCGLARTTTDEGGTAFAELQESRGRASTDSLYDMTFGHDIPLARNTATWLQELDADNRVFVIIAHDSTVRDGVDHFPKSLNDWKAKGLGHSLKWAFFRDLEPYFRDKGVI